LAERDFSEHTQSCTSLNFMIIKINIYNACERINSDEPPLVGLQANVKINVARNLPEKLKGTLAAHAL
jgi:hypothetical protein